MEASRQELTLDLEEVQKLLTQCSRPQVLERLLLIQSEIQQQLQVLPSEQLPPQAQQSTSSQVVYQAISKFAWEQDTKSVKVYVLDMPGLRELDSQNIEVSHDNQSVDLKIHNFNNKNYRLRFPKLDKEISGARFSARSSGFTLYLTKKGTDHWSQVEFKPSALNANRKNQDEDPQAGLMTMMKEMYENGDDDMKRTIAEAWTKSREGKDNQLS